MTEFTYEHRLGTRRLWVVGSQLFGAYNSGAPVLKAEYPTEEQALQVLMRLYERLGK